MILKSLSLINYKNFDTKTFDFDTKINCLVGPNGIGKTNVLDAIYHLSFGKSYFNPIASQNIKHNEDFFVVDGFYDKEKRDEKIIISLKKGQKKIIKRNGKPYERFSDHIGFLPLVIISPADRDLIIEGSDTRRKFIDSVISQGDKIYLSDLIKYQKLIAQRNALLKYFALNNTFNKDSLEVYNEQLNAIGKSIFLKRDDTSGQSALGKLFDASMSAAIWARNGAMNMSRQGLLQRILQREETSEGANKLNADKGDVAQLTTTPGCRHPVPQLASVR